MPSAQIRFGAFEVDLRAGELRRKGLQVKLQEQPFQVLAMLLERVGEVVTREELQTKLWPADTIVDFDHGLNKAINKIRKALGDSAENPRFVETVARRGYRFIADVRVVDGSPLDRPEPVIEDSPATDKQDPVESGGKPRRTQTRAMASCREDVCHRSGASVGDPRGLDASLPQSRVTRNSVPGGASTGKSLQRPVAGVFR